MSFKLRKELYELFLRTNSNVGGNLTQGDIEAGRESFYINPCPNLPEIHITRFLT